MKENTVLIEKNFDGSYTVTMKSDFLKIAKMAFAGEIKMNLPNELAQTLSKALYEPAKKPYRPRKRPATSVNK
jgi:hypothetical protein